MFGPVCVFDVRADGPEVDMLPNSADILVTEIFDSVLLGEGVLPTLQHAWECLLAPHAVIVPDRAVVYAQVRTPLVCICALPRVCMT